MITIKNDDEIALMREAGKLAKLALVSAGQAIKPGITTTELDEIVEGVIVNAGAKPAFKGYGGFPASACISVNDEVIHGIPNGRTLCEGDIVSIDVGTLLNGYHGDCAMTFPCGKISNEAKKLIDVTRQSFYEGIKVAREGNRIGDISSAIQAYAENEGYYVVRNFVGHGIGANLHEEPQVPNFGKAGKGPRLVKGMTIAIEPMINEGTIEVMVLEDKWTVKTVDGSLSAHYENVILITDDTPEILTYHDYDK